MPLVWYGALSRRNSTSCWTSTCSASSLWISLKINMRIISESTVTKVVAAYIRPSVSIAAMIDSRFGVWCYVYVAEFRYWLPQLVIVVCVIQCSLIDINGQLSRPMVVQHGDCILLSEDQAPLLIHPLVNTTYRSIRPPKILLEYLTNECVVDFQLLQFQDLLGNHICTGNCRCTLVQMYSSLSNSSGLIVSVILLVIFFEQESWISIVSLQ